RVGLDDVGRGAAGVAGAGDGLDRRVRGDADLDGAAGRGGGEPIEQVAHGEPGRGALGFEAAVVGGEHGGDERVFEAAVGAVVGRLAERDKLLVEGGSQFFGVTSAWWHGPILLRSFGGAERAGTGRGVRAADRRGVKRSSRWRRSFTRG